MPERIEADYLIECARAPAEAVAAALVRQHPGAGHAAPSLDALQERDRTQAPRPAGGPAERHGRTAFVSLSWPLDLVGPSLTGLMALVAGEILSGPDFTGAKLVGLRLPRAFAAAYPGPAFGVEGTRRLSGVARRPLIAAAATPAPGRSPADTAASARALCEAGVDLIHDHPLACDSPMCPFEERVRAVLDVVDSHAQASGKRVMYAANVSGTVDDMRARHDLLLELGGTALMVGLGTAGLAGIEALRRHSQLPIHTAHIGWDLFDRHPMQGIATPAAQVAWRLAGCDHIPLGGPAGGGDIGAAAAAATAPLYPEKHMAAMPIFGGAADPCQIAAAQAAAGGADLIFAADAVIHAHPEGPAAAIAALHRALPTPG